MGISFKDHPSLTKQSFKDECDANSIMSRWSTSGELSHISRVLPQYGDFSSVEDYQSALNRIHDMERAFSQLPSEIRARFRNSPEALLEFVQDESNRQEALDLGLVEEPEATDQAESTPSMPEGGQPDTSGSGPHSDPQS